MGLLDLRRISWQHSSGDLLQKVMQCARRHPQSAHVPCTAQVVHMTHPLQCVQALQTHCINGAVAPSSTSNCRDATSKDACT